MLEDVAENPIKAAVIKANRACLKGLVVREGLLRRAKTGMVYNLQAKGKDGA
jgi:hypothetical protein